MKRDLVPFGDDRVRLRLLDRRDLEATLAWRNRDEARVWFKSSGQIAPADHEAWFERYRLRDDDFVFIVEADGRPVGQASVYGIDWAARAGEVGRFLVAPGEAGKGYLGRACRELVRFCHGALGLTYLYLEVLPGNDRAIHLYTRAGFVEEGRTGGLIRMGRRGRAVETPIAGHGRP
jgi:diamine N-acetyltransferase